ncbi:MAG: VanZ family protein [Steroidobacteraceae bacterium]
MQALRWQPWWFAGGIVIALAIAVLSLLPSADLPKVQLWDKFEHGFAYLALAAWFGGIVRPDRYLRLALVLLGFGIAIEIAQGAMGFGRTADVADVLANAAGIVIGLGVALVGVSGWMRGVERLCGAALSTAD